MSPCSDLLLLDSGGTIFDLSAQAPLSMNEVFAQRFTRAAAAARAIGWSGEPAAFADRLANLEETLKRRLGVAYGFDKLLIEAGEQLQPELRPELALLCVDAFAGPRYKQWLFPGAADAFTELRKAGVRLAIVANTDWPESAMRRALSGVGLERFFDAVVCSCDVGVAKPNPGIYRHTLDLLGVAPSTRVCFVGDHLDCDIRGPKQFGLSTAFRRSSCSGSAGEADFEFERWEELKSWVCGG